MTTVAGIAVVMAIVQFFKKLLPQFVVGATAIVLVVVASAGVTIYKFVSEGVPLGISTITFFVEVIVGALSAYSLIKVAGGNGNS